MTPRPRFRRLTGSGPAALSAWRLQGPPEEVARALGGRLPGPAPMHVRVPAGDSGDQVDTLDEGVAHRVDAEVWEICLHGGHGVARAWRARLGELGWEEDMASPAAWVAARSPLAARVLLAGAGAPPWADWDALSADARRALAAARLPYRRWSAWLAEPPRVVVAGPANAGKSSLCNALLQEERITVSPHPGTTRDAVEAGLLLGAGADAFEVRLIDTAGHGGEQHALDAAAVARSRRERARAACVLWVLDAAHAPPAEVVRAVAAAGRDDLLLIHRADLPPGWDDAAMTTDFPGRALGRASLHRDGATLVARLAEALAARFGPPPPPGLALPGDEAIWRRFEAACEAGAG